MADTVSEIKIKFYFSIVAWLILLAFMKFGEEPSPKKANNDWVLDMTNILGDRTENKLNQMIYQLNSDNETEIAVVTVPEISPTSSSEDKYWEIGKVERDNGVLFLISARDRQTEILTGYEITEILTDEKVNKIINTQIIPQFKQKHFDEGTLAGTNELISVIKFGKFWETVFGSIILFFIIFAYVLLGGGGGGSSGGGYSGSASAAGSCGSSGGAAGGCCDCGGSEAGSCDCDDC
jgi:uncharacterized protein